MKKLLFTLALGLMVTMQLMAEKTNVYIAKFASESEVSKSTVSLVRNSVISGISATNRITLIDASTTDLVKAAQDYETSEAALSDPTAHAALVQLGIDYIISGVVTSETVTKSTDKSGSVSYSAKVIYTLKLNKVADGSLVSSEQLSESGYSSSSESDALASCKPSKASMNRVIQKWFPLKASVLPNDYEIDTKKNVMTVCYVELGEDHGIKSGQMIEVSVINIIAGRETVKPIGTLKVTEVLAGDLSKCKVTKGGDVILKAMQDYESMLTDDPDNAKPLIVKTRASNRLVDIGKELIEF